MYNIRKEIDGSAEDVEEIKGNRLFTADYQIQWRSDATYIYSSATGQLDTVASGVYTVTAPTTTITASTLGAVYTPDFRVGFDTGSYMKVAVADTTGVTAVTFAGSGATYTLTVPTFTVVAASGIKLDGAITFDGDGTLTDAANVLTITQDTITLVGATAISLDGDTSVNAAHTFTTGTGNVTIKGDMSIDADKDFDMSGGTGTFATGTGNVSLNGDVTIAADKNLAMSGTATFTTGTGDVTINGQLIATKLPTSDATPTIGIGNCGTRLVDTSVADSLFFQSVVTACAKDTAGNSTAAGYFSSNNVAATANARLQSVLAHTYLSGDCNDAYGVQGHLTVLQDVAAGGAAYNLIGVSGKATLTSGKTVSAGRVCGGLFIVDGAGSVTNECYGVMIHTESTVTACDALLKLSAGAAVTTGISMTGEYTNSILLPDDAPMLIGTTRTDASTYIGMEFDETTTGVGLFTMGSTSAPMVLNTNPGANVIGHTINILHSAGAGDNENLYGSYVKAAITGEGDTDTVLVGSAPRAYIGTNGGTTVASAAYGCQPWAKHEGTGAVTAMSGVSALVDVNTDAFTASTVNAGHFHIEGAATVTGQFDGVMIEAYPDVTCMDSMLALAVDSGAVVGSGVRITGTPKNGILFQNGVSISGGAGTDDTTIKSEQGETAPAGSIYIGSSGVHVMVSTTWTALTIN